MSIRLKLTLTYSFILLVSFAAMGFTIYKMQEFQMVNSLRDDLESTAGVIVQVLERRGPAKRPQPSQTAETSSMDPANVDKEAPSFDSDGPFSQRPPESFEEIFRDEPRKVLDIVNILSLEWNLVFNPIQRNAEIIPITEECQVELDEKGHTWEVLMIDGEEYMTVNQVVKEAGMIAGYVQVARPTTSVRTFLSDLLRVMLTIGAFALVVSALLGYYISGFTLKRVDHISQTASEIRAEQDFSKRVEYEGPQDEIGRLAKAFNEMLGNIQLTYDKLNHSLLLQRNFVADVSHELRTPLTTIRGNLALLNSGKHIESSEHDEIMSDVVEETDRLITLVNNLLIIARADIEEKILLRDTALRPIVDEVVRNLSVLDPQRQVTINIPDHLVFPSEKSKLKQLLLTLLDNAYKHSDSPIEIEAESGEDWTAISVIDHGPGICQKDIDKVFERFSRGSNAVSGTGYGLGLPIAKALSRSLNGLISVTSEPNVRTSFTIIFHKLQQQ